MSPQEKGKQLVTKFRRWQHKSQDMAYTVEQIEESVNLYAKQCALIAVEEMIDEIECMKALKELKSTKRYLSFWEQVRKEISKL